VTSGPLTRQGGRERGDERQHPPEHDPHDVAQNVGAQLPSAKSKGLKWLSTAITGASASRAPTMLLVDRPTGGARIVLDPQARAGAWRADGLGSHRDAHREDGREDPGSDGRGPGARS